MGRSTQNTLHTHHERAHLQWTESGLRGYRWKAVRMLAVDLSAA
jgi:hypothetical protein